MKWHDAGFTRWHTTGVPDMARIAVEFTVTVELDVPDELAARMMDDLAETAHLAAHHCGGSCPLVVANEFAGSCRFSLLPLREGLVPEDITLGVYPEWMFPRVEDADTTPLLVSVR
jgi:hypothetical protein